MRAVPTEGLHGKRGMKVCSLRTVAFDQPV